MDTILYAPTSAERPARTVTAIALNMLLVEGFDMHRELGDIAMWGGYFLTCIAIGVAHTRIALKIGAA